MAQFDVYRLAGGELALDVQTDLLSGIHTRVVIPLLPIDEAVVAHPRLNPIVNVEDKPYVVVPQAMIALEARELHQPVASLDNRYDDIRAALDMIFLGF
jgi:toxin CcdB